jgi:hypothetical protein
MAKGLLTRRTLGWCLDRGRGPALTLACLLASQAHAQLITCSSSASGAAYKIFVDEVKTTSTTPASAAKLKDLSGLRDFVVADLRNLTDGQASILRCDKRFPRDSSDFDDIEVNALDNQRVLLEVWGAVEDSAASQGSLGFVLVPAWKLTPSAVYVVPRNGASFLDQAKQGTELRAFAPLVRGIRAYRNNAYDESIPLLCRGAQQLEALLQKPSQPGEAALRAAEQSLLTNVGKIVSDAITKARVTPGSRYLLLRPTAQGQFSCPTT